MYCKNLRKRQKNYKVVFYCKEYKEYINSLDKCKNCSKIIFRQNKAIKKIGSKRIFVTSNTYEEVFNRDKGQCRLADENCKGKLDLHHIIYRSEDKNLINEPTNCILLCNYHHRLVHSNKHYWQPKLKEIVKE